MTKTDMPVDEDIQPMPIQKKGGVSKTAFVVTTILVLILGFVIGTRSDEIIANVPFMNKRTNAPSVLNLSSVQQTYRTLLNNYEGKLDTDKLIEGANRGMVEAAGDPYTTYFSKQEANEFMNDLEGTFSGIGAELGRKDDKLVVVTTLDNSPAKKAGLMKDDIIAKVNDEATSGWSVDKAVSHIRGEKGTTVKLTVLRGDEVKDISITRDKITDPSVKAEVTKDKIGILRISRFGETDTVALAKKAAIDFKSQGVKSVIVDLRGNGGGYLEAATDIAGLWLHNGDVIVSERANGRVTDELRASGDPILKGVPTAVLIDGGSASASEILAGALKDHKAAKLVGEQTYGKGSVQQIVDMPFGAKLKVTIAKWYTPNGKNIDKEGISPDVKVGFSAKEAKAGKDPQKDRAIKLLTR
jgi:carboxyl-terminal processing protease